MLDFTIPDVGEKMHTWASDLWPMNRSLTGEGVRETLSYLQSILPELKIRSVPSGSQAFDWTVPKEWKVRSARLIGPDGEVIADFEKNNLHLVGYSIPVDKELSLEELQPHLYSLPDQPNAIPYITSYYSPHWGFCITHEVREKLSAGKYRAIIDSELFDGVLNYGELIIPGETDEEIFLSTYVCHPSMANNELSGPVVTAAIAEWINERPHRYTYRIVFIPETIGAIVYISKHLEELRKNVIAGYVLTCIGDDRSYSFLPSREDGTIADRAGRLSLTATDPQFKEYSFLTRGSDERQYCSPGVDLPVASIMRSKYATFPEYHTSLDDLTLVTPTGLQGGFAAAIQALAIIENNYTFSTIQPCEPQLGKRGLYPTVSTKSKETHVRTLLNIVAYADGKRDFIDLCTKIEANPALVAESLSALVEKGVMRRL